MSFSDLTTRPSDHNPYPTPASEPVPEGTPETDVACFCEPLGDEVVQSDFARRLETERNAALHRAEAAEREASTTRETLSLVRGEIDKLAVRSGFPKCDNVRQMLETIGNKVERLTADLAAARARADAAEAKLRQLAISDDEQQ